ncbi:MAG: hypothetical protein Q9201_007783 [Fulgogasparrea decipioides]
MTCAEQLDMQPSRIAQDLMRSGFDPELHLAIAQESFHELRLSQDDLPEMEREYAELLRILRHSQSSHLRERLRRLGEEIGALREDLKGAPRRIEVLKNDIALLRGHLTAIRGDDCQQDPNTKEAKTVMVNGAAYELGGQEETSGHR